MDTDSASIADFHILDHADDPEAPTVRFMPFLTGPGVGYITGVITDSSLSPVENVFVQVVDTPFSGSTGPDGRFLLQGMETGYYDLSFTHDDYIDTLVAGLFAVIHDTAVVDMVLTEWTGCYYVVGDANANEIYNGLDITYGVSYLKGGDPPPYQCECAPHGTWYVAGDVNGNCDYNGLDITFGINFLKGLTPEIFHCPDCPPVGR